MAHIRIPVDSHHQLIANTIETVQDNVSLALGCIQAQLWVQYMTAAITWEGEDGTLPAEIPAECSLPLKGGMPQWAPSPPHLQHSEMPHRSQRPIVAEAQCPAALLQCSSFTGAVKTGMHFRVWLCDCRSPGPGSAQPLPGTLVEEPCTPGPGSLDFPAPTNC